MGHFTDILLVLYTFQYVHILIEPVHWWRLSMSKSDSGRIRLEEVGTND